MLPIKSKLLLEVSVSCEGSRTKGVPLAVLVRTFNLSCQWNSPFERDERILQGVVILRRSLRRRRRGGHSDWRSEVIGR